MNSKKDKKQIVSYFCILFLLCGVHTISGICREEKIPDGMQLYDLEAEEDAQDSHHYLAEGPLINDGTTVRHTVYRSQHTDAVSAPAYNDEKAYYGTGSISPGAFIISVIFTIMAARHLLC